MDRERESAHTSDKFAKGQSGVQSRSANGGGLHLGSAARLIHGRDINGAARPARTNSASWADESSLTAVEHASSENGALTNSRCKRDTDFSVDSLFTNRSFESDNVHFGPIYEEDLIEEKMAEELPAPVERGQLFARSADCEYTQTKKDSLTIEHQNGEAGQRPRCHSDTMLNMQLLNEDASLGQATSPSICGQACRYCDVNLRQVLHLLRQHSGCHRSCQMASAGSHCSQFHDRKLSPSYSMMRVSESDQPLFGVDAPAAAWALAWATGSHRSHAQQLSSQHQPSAQAQLSCGSANDSLHQTGNFDPEMSRKGSSNQRSSLSRLNSTERSTAELSRSMAFGGSTKTKRSRENSTLGKKDSALAAMLSHATVNTLNTAAATVGQPCDQKVASSLHQARNLKQITLEAFDEFSQVSDSSSGSTVDSTEKPMNLERVRNRRGGGEVRRIGAPGGPLGPGVQPLVGAKEQSKAMRAHNRSIGWRLSRRKQLNERRRRVSDYSLAFAFFGLAVIIIDTELVLANAYSKCSFFSIIMRALCSVSTFVLVGLVLAYNGLEIQLFSVNNCIEDWRIAIDPRRVVQTMVEVLVCIVHPPPINISPLINCRARLESNLTESVLATTSMRSFGRNSSRYLVVDPSHCVHTNGLPPHLDEWLALLMFCRLYLIFRVLLLHSRMFTDASSRSIGALNRVQFNVRFVLKTLMTICPGTVLLVFIITFWIIFSWIYRICDRKSGAPCQHIPMADAMWLIAITFLSIGYGDEVPHNKCGRSVAVITGVLGSCCTALVVAVFARKLELKRAEKHVHNFMLDNRIYKQLRNAAANVLRETWLFYKYTKLVKRVHPAKVRRHQRKFLQAIHSLRRAKEEQRKLKDDSSSMIDLAKTQTNIFDIVLHLRGEQNILGHRLQSIEDHLAALQNQLSLVPDLSMGDSPQQETSNEGPENNGSEQMARARRYRR